MATANAHAHASDKAQARQLADAPPPGSKTPAADDHRLRDLGATEAFPRKWEYLHPAHRLRDLVRPGYFGGEARARLRPGDEIHYTAGAGRPSPSEWERGILIVEENPSTRERPLIVAILHRHGKATPVRHDGEAD